MGRDPGGGTSDVGSRRESGRCRDEVELVSLWVGERPPPAFAMVNVVQLHGTEIDEPIRFGVVVGGGEIEVDPVLDDFAFWDLVEEESEPVARRDGSRGVG